MDIAQQASQTYISNEQEITRIKRIIDRHEDKIEKIRNENWWGDVILRPILNTVEEHFNKVGWRFDQLTPMGLRCAVSVFGTLKTDDGEQTIMLRFTPSGDGFVELDIKPEYSTHGFGSKTAVVDGIDVVFNHIKTQIKEKC